MHRYYLTNRNCYLHQQILKLGLQVSDFEFLGLGVLGLVVGGLEVWRFRGWVSRFVVLGFQQGSRCEVRG